MKRILFILSICLVAFASQAQLASKIRTLKVVNQGEYVSFNTKYTDTLKSNDTLAYVINITHVNDINFVLDQRSKVVANDTTVTIKFFESIDGVNYYATQAGASPSAYTKTFAKGASNTLYDSNYDVCWFNSRYLKIMFISSTKSGFKKCMYGYLKTSIK